MPMTNANVDAAIWYRKMQTFKDLPQDYALNYGLLLKRMGQYDKAKEYFDRGKENGARGKWIYINLGNREATEKLTKLLEPLGSLD